MIDAPGSSAILDDDDDTPSRPSTSVKRKTLPTKKAPAKKAAKKSTPPPPKKAKKAATPPSGWRAGLQLVPVKDRQGVTVDFKTKPNAFNVAMILSHHPVWKGVLEWNEFAECITKTRKLPPVARLATSTSEAGAWTDQDTAHTLIWLQANEQLQIAPADFHVALLTAARSNSRHPVRDYLNGLKWDGKKRLEKVLVDYFGAEDTPYVRGVTRMWFISAVARVMEPGCQADYALILEGEQGVGKSQSLRGLTPERQWYSETGIVLGNKDSYQNLHGIWIYCLDEMASVHGAEVRTMKNFLTSPDDRYRPSYGRFPQSFLRQNVFVCTINPEQGYFADRTGNRRFWPIATTTVKPGISKVRDQLWAEARKLYAKKMPADQRPTSSRWWPDTEMTALCAEQQKQRLMPEPWTEVVGDWIRKGCPRRDELGSFTAQKVNLSRGLTTSEALIHAIGIRPDQLNTGVAMRMARVLKELGHTRSSRETHEGVRDYYYRPGAPVIAAVAGGKEKG